jgi:hypothetical protein
MSTTQNKAYNPVSLCGGVVMPRFRAIENCKALLNNIERGFPSEENLQMRLDLVRQLWVYCIKDMSKHLDRCQVSALSSSGKPLGVGVVLDIPSKRYPPHEA